MKFNFILKSSVLSILYLLIILPQSLLAQGETYNFTKIDNTDGLSHNQVNCFYRDKLGFMWFGTMSGLNRYDGYDFKVFKHDINDSNSISDNFILDIKEGPENKMWILTRNGFNIYDPATEKFEFITERFVADFGLQDFYFADILKDKNNKFWIIRNDSGFFYLDPSTKTSISFKPDPSSTAHIATNAVSTIAQNSKGNLWIMHKNGILEKINPDSKKVIYRDSTFFKNSKRNNLDYKIFIDSDDDLWIYYVDQSNGVYLIEDNTKKLFHFHNESKTLKLNSNIVKDVIEDNKGKVWIGTDHGGINIIDKKAKTVSYLLHESDNEKSLSQNSIYSLYKDSSGIIWIGTFKKGLNYYHENIYKFHENEIQKKVLNRFNSEDVNCFAEDENGNFWIGTNGAGLYFFERKTGSFTKYMHNPQDPNTISSNIIVSLFIDHQQKLWIGTYYGGLNYFDGKKFKHFKHDPKDAGSISDDRVWEIYEDSQKNFWIGTLGSGLDLFDRENNTFKNFKAGEKNSIHSNYIFSITEDRHGNLFIGTAYGLDVLEKDTDFFIHYKTHDPPSGITNDNIFKVIEDSRGMIWIATREGLNIFDNLTKTFRAFTTSNGLPDNTILSIVEDDDSNLWLSTNNGISKLKVEKNTNEGYSFSFKNFDKSDGLSSDGFNERAGYKTKRGELIFCSPNGINMFHPATIEINAVQPEIVLTDFHIFNKQVKVGETINGRVILATSISEVPQITLKHNENIFSIEFAALSFFHPQKNQYAYMLEGFNKEWLFTDKKSRRATFTNLDPGEYIFKVKASNNDGVWNDEGIALHLTVLPPFWKTKIAISIYGLIIFCALLLSRKLIQERERIRFMTKQEKEASQRMHELDLMKIKFFTNVSHEFRTPLTLILAPLEKLLKQASDPVQKNQYEMIHRNARRLLNLVNQLLDFRKIEVQGIKLVSSKGDIVKFIEEATYQFSDLSEKKNIHLTFKSEVQNLETFFDQDKLEKIIFNLLSNAFKFTPVYGKVSVTVSMKEHQQSLTDELQWLEIQVADNGIGIPADKQDSIFERFFQNEIPGTLVNQGSGIGLSITKEFVKLHGGSISVESESEKGSCFSVLLPLKNISAEQSAETILNNILYPEAEVVDSVELEASIKPKKNKKPFILIVEDNEDFRFYLKDNLAIDYNIIEAADGKEGLKAALKNLPDLIVSDVMMPQMDGLELCKKLKKDKKTAHIPIILLTARTAEEQKVQGFETGANDYITKPFNFEILVSRIKNLLKQKESFQEALKTKLEVNPTKLQITSLDQQLIQKAVEIVEKNISEPDFSVNDLSKELGMSRVHLYKKIMNITGTSPIEFIRNIRLKRAAQLLEESQLTISEIAYEVGFNNPKYFSKYFKEAYNKLPSVYSQEHAASNSKL